MIDETQVGEDKVIRAYDRRETGVNAYKTAMVINGITGKVTFPQQEDLRVAAAIGTEAANAIDVACQIVDQNGIAVGGAKEVLIRTLAVTSAQGTLAAATAAVGTLRKTNNAATGESTQWMTATNGGAFSFKVTDNAAELVLVSIEIDGARASSFTLNFALV